MLNRISQSTVYQQCPRLVTHLMGLAELPVSSSLSPSLLHLVKLHASQLNRCGFCQKMHADEARHDGESQGRLDVFHHTAARSALRFAMSSRASSCSRCAAVGVASPAEDQRCPPAY